MPSDILQIEISNLRAENRSLRRRLSESTGDMRRLRQSYRDAKAMLLHRFAGYSISRKSSLSLGISRRRWVWAIGLLRLAGIHNGYDVIEHDVHVALLSLESTFQALDKAGTIARLRLRLPPSATR